MRPSEMSRVLISCARKNGATCRQRLQSDLKKRSFDTSLDTRRITAAAVWSTEIEHRIDTRRVDARENRAARGNATAHLQADRRTLETISSAAQPARFDTSSQDFLNAPGLRR